LVEFTSVVDAVAAAIAIQTRQAAGPDPDLTLRIGVNLGDVTIDGADIYGNGVNIAARLEALAEPGGICISSLAHQSLGNKIEASFTDLGPQDLKNIEAPIRAFRWTAAAPPSNQKTKLEDKAGIVVLAFDNMSADPEQEYFSDGIAEDIFTALSHFREFHVIARNTGFTLKSDPCRSGLPGSGRPLPPGWQCPQIGQPCTLHRTADRCRDRVSYLGQSLRPGLDDIFAVQDEIIQAIVGAVAPEAMDAETKRVSTKRPDNLSVWNMILQARWHVDHFDRDNNAAVRALLTTAFKSESELANIHCPLRFDRHALQLVA